MFPENVIIYLCLIVKAVDKRHRVELYEILIPCLVFCKKYEVLGGVALMLVHILGEVEFTAYYVLYACNRRLFGKMQSAVHIAVVGDAYGVYAVIFTVIN